MPIKSFRGMMNTDSGGDSTGSIILHTNNGTTGYRITKLQIIPKDPTDTTNEEESFTTGQIYQTSRIFKNELDIQKVKVNLFIRSVDSNLVVNKSLPGQRWDIYLE